MLIRNLSTDFFRYLPVGDRDRQWGLYATAGGFNAIGASQPHPRPGHPDLYAYLKTGSDETLLRAYTTLLDRLRSEPVGFQQLLAAGVMEILAAALAAVRGQGSGARTHQLIRQAKAAIESPDAASTTIDNLAASLGLSPTRFYRVFKEHTGFSPHQYLQQERIRRAKQMLQGTNMNTKQIAVALGFQTPFHFSNVFKRKTGMSPTDWRRRSQAGSRQEIPTRRGLG